MGSSAMSDSSELHRVQYRVYGGRGRTRTDSAFQRNLMRDLGLTNFPTLPYFCFQLHYIRNRTFYCHQTFNWSRTSLLVPIPAPGFEPIILSPDYSVCENRTQGNNVRLAPLKCFCLCWFLAEVSIDILISIETSCFDPLSNYF